MKVTEVLERENWRMTRVETDEYVFYIEETLLILQQEPGKNPKKVWAKTACHAAARPEAVERIMAAQGKAQVEIAKQVQDALHPCESCGGKPEYLKCPRCGREP